MAGMSTTAACAALDHLTSTTNWPAIAGAFISLHTDDPGETGANEVAGGGYGRQGDTPFAAAVGNPAATYNTSDIDFTNLPACTLRYGGLWNQASGGTFLAGGPLTQEVEIVAGDGYTIKAGDFDITQV
jgi:hypothetical protein